MKALDDAVEAGAVVEALLGQFLEVLDGLRRDIRPELDDHFAFGGLDHGDFFCIHRAFLLLCVGLGARLGCFVGLFRCLLGLG